MKTKKKELEIFSNMIWNEEGRYTIIPSTDNEEIIPKIRILDSHDDGTYWYRKIGFNRTIISEER